MGRVFSVEIEMRWADLDAYGHVNNVAFFSYLETARVKLWLDSGFDFQPGSLQTLVARAECDYLKPILLSDQVVITMEIPRIGNSSFDIHYTVHNGAGVTYATGRTVMVCFDPKTIRTVSVPEVFRTAAS